MEVLRAEDVTVAFGPREVLRGADLRLAPGERAGLVGANGSGKTTLLRAISGELRPDGGAVSIRGRLGYLPQVPRLTGSTVRACVDDALSWHRTLVADYERAMGRGDAAAAARLQDRLDHVGWEVQHRVDALLDQLGAPPQSAATDRLSGGEVRRVALALALLGRPDVLILDEPTNHLDMSAVAWLETWLQRYTGACLLVTHDRYLLEATATRIVEIEDGRCVGYPGSYGDYLVARVARQASREKAETRRLRFLAREAAWAARSPAARTTKQKARLQRLAEAEEQRPLEMEQGFALDLRTGARHRGTLLELHGVTKRYATAESDGPELLAGLDLTLLPGERLGVLGPNGAGKSTLLRILAGAEAPDRGERVRASRTQIAVLDQARTGLEAPDGADQTVFEAAGGGNSHVRIAGRAGASWQRGAGGTDAGFIHVASFLQRFLFSREALDQKVSALSGGERARLLLARLLLQGASVLLLDEPTNDLDLLTLRVLEEALLGFDGAVVVVTHDRAFLDRVCTGVLSFEQGPSGEGQVVRYASRQQQVRANAERRGRKSAAAAPQADRPRTQTRARLSWKETQELAGLPDRIEELETEQTALAERLGDPATYRLPPDQQAALQARAAELPEVIEALVERWGELEERSG